MPEKPPQKIPPRGKAKDFVKVTEEDLDGDQLATLLEAEGDPFATLKAAGKAAGLQDKVVAGLMKRLRAQYGEVTEELKNIHSGMLAEELTKKAWMALSYLDDFSMSQMSAKDAAIVVGILLEKRQLLRGEPTQIISVEERAGLDELSKAILKETERRGLTIDMEPTDVSIVPPDMARATRPRASGNMPIKQRLEIAQNKAKDEIGEPR